MEGIGAAASIGQLVQYGGVVTVTLISLIKDISRGPLVYKNEEGNIRLLLRLIRRVSTETDCHTHDEARDDFLELFTRVNLIAHSILQLLGKTSCFVFRVISAVTRHSSLAEAFQALCNARELLHLHITSTLNRYVRAYLESGTRNMDQDPGSDPRGRAAGTNASPIEERSPSGRYNVRNNVVGNRTFYEIGHDVKSTAEAAARSQGTVTVDNNKIGEDVFHKIGDISDRAGLNRTLEIFGKNNEANAPKPAPPGMASEQPAASSSTIRYSVEATISQRNQSRQQASCANNHEAPVIGGDRFAALERSLNRDTNDFGRVDSEAEDDGPVTNKKEELVTSRR